MTFRAWESVSYYATTQRELKHRLYKIHWFKKKKKKMQHVEQNNFPPFL